MKRWTPIIRLIREGEVDMPLKFKYEDFLSLKFVCLRESKKTESKFVYRTHYSNGNVVITKSLKDAESSQPRLSAE